jgi:uncharacterized protein YcbK (DUF882 family)
MNYSLMHFLEYLLFSNVHFTVTSARRTPEQNKACNGAPNSQHLTGEAIDIKSYGNTSFDKLLEMIHNCKILNVNNLMSLVSTEQRKV